MSKKRAVPTARGENFVTFARPLPKHGEARVPEGEYAAVLAGYQTWALCHGWAPRVVLVFTLVDPPNFGIAIGGYYRVIRLQGKPRRNGQFAIGTRSRLYRDLARMLGRRPPTNVVPLEDLTSTYTVVVRDVTHDRDQHPIGAAAYSVVDWVMGAA